MFAFYFISRRIIQTVVELHVITLRYTVHVRMSKSIALDVSNLLQLRVRNFLQILTTSADGPVKSAETRQG